MKKNALNDSDIELANKNGKNPTMLKNRAYQIAYGAHFYFCTREDCYSMTGNDKISLECYDKVVDVAQEIVSVSLKHHRYIKHIENKRERVIQM